MLTFGLFADTFGRRIGSCSTASIMAIGAVLTAAASGADINGQWIMFAVVLFFFSYGVGGEYPLASASAAERAETARETNNYVTQLRGKTVVLTFAMQGVGNFINTLIIVLILLGENCTGSTCDSKSYEITWRLQYAIGAFVVCCLAVGRIVFLKESEVWKKAHEERQEVENKDRLSRSRKLMFVKYWHRLVGTAVGWFVWDIVFYGNKLFQGKIIATIVGSDATIYTTLKYTLLNSGIALIGYYVAAFTIDKKWMGRRRMQTIGFSWIFALFLICGVAYDKLILPENIKYFQALYLLSSFWGQLGPNSTTWLLPSELFPTDVRSQAHGISAASGKLGALFATLLFTYGDSGDSLDSQVIFIVCAVCGIVGLIVTEVFVPDVSHLDLRHLDDRWNFVLDGRAKEYSGDAVRPHFLSVYERCTGIARSGDEFSSSTSSGREPAQTEKVDENHNPVSMI